MSTGDLKNNLRKLQRLLKRIRYKDEVDYESMSRGLPTAFLPVYHYAFTSYSRHLLSKLNEMDIHLFGTNDMRFVELMYKSLRDAFGYKPVVPKDKFFQAGFAERKVIMCTDIIENVIKFHQDSEPRKPKSIKKPLDIVCQLEKPDGTFPDLVTTSTEEVIEVKTTDIPSTDRPFSAPAIEKKTPPHTIVKEKAVPEYTPALYAAPQTVTSTLTQKHVPRVVALDVDTSDDVSERPQVEVIRMTDQDRREVLEQQKRPRDLVSHTPVHPSINPEASLVTITRKLERLTQRMISLDERLASVEGILSIQERERMRDESQGLPLSPSQVENILARLTLVESRVKSIKSKAPGSRFVRVVNGPTTEQWLNGDIASQEQAPTPPNSNGLSPDPGHPLYMPTTSITRGTTHVAHNSGLPSETPSCERTPGADANELHSSETDSVPSHLSPINPVEGFKKSHQSVVSDLISQVVRENGSESSEASPRISTPTEEGSHQLSFIFNSLSQEQREQALRIHSMLAVTKEQLSNNA